MKEIFIISKNTSLPNYLFSLLEEIYPGKLTLALDFATDLDLLVIDSETISPREMEKYMVEIPTILYTNKILPLLIQYTSKYDLNGIISMNMEASDILKTITTALKQDIYYNEMMISLLFSTKSNMLAEKVSSITEREQEILIMMMKDMTNEEIADKLNLSVRTVNAHKGNIMRKIGSKTTSGLIHTLFQYSPSFRNSL